jgi:hypothetical protein
MSYLARLKQLNGEKQFLHTSEDELTKLPKSPFCQLCQCHE